jgi:protein-L-isoaspartate(D-aspartate) O-methyltransferase
MPDKLIEQLKDYGEMIVPVGKAHSVQLLKLITKRGNQIVEEDLLPVRFVPMIR